MTWKTIDSAPQDGTPFLIASTAGTGPTLGVFEGDYFRLVHNRHKITGVGIWFWQPLPAPPNPKGGDEPDKIAQRRSAGTSAHDPAPDVKCERAGGAEPAQGLHELDPTGLEAALSTLGLPDHATYQRIIRSAIKAYVETAPASTCCKGLAPPFECRCERDRRAADALSSMQRERDEAQAQLAELDNALDLPKHEPCFRVQRILARLDDALEGEGDALDCAEKAEARVVELEASPLPPLTDDMIRGACKGFYRTTNIDGTSMSFRGADYSFRTAFTRMWNGVARTLLNRGSDASR